MKGLERADRLIAQAGSAAWPGPRAWNMVGVTVTTAVCVGQAVAAKRNARADPRHLSQAAANARVDWSFSTVSWLLCEQQ